MESYLVFYLLRGRNYGWEFYSTCPSLVEAEQKALEVMDTYKDQINQIRVMEHIHCGRPRKVTAITWTN